jgi:hypothetical protein
LITQTREALFGESSSPPADVPGAHIQPGCDLDVRQAPGGVQDQPGALHIPKRRLLQRRDALKFHALFLAEDDLGGPRRHRHHDSTQAT